MAQKIVPDYAQKEIDHLIALYESADMRVQAILNDAIASGKLGKHDYYLERRKDIVQVLTQLNQASSGTLSTIVQKSYSTASVLTANSLQQQLGKPVVSTFSEIDNQAVALLNTNLQNKLVDIHTVVGRRADDVLRQVGLREVALGKIVSEDRVAITRAIAQGIADSGVTTSVVRGQQVLQLVNIGNRNYRLNTYASMVARTTSREAASHATVNRVTQNGLDLVQVSEHGADDSSCAEYEGQIYSVSGNSTIYPQLVEMPPFHPNCIHVLMPYVDMAEYA